MFTDANCVLILLTFRDLETSRAVQCSAVQWASVGARTTRIIKLSFKPGGEFAGNRLIVRSRMISPPSSRNVRLTFPIVEANGPPGGFACWSDGRTGGHTEEPY